MQAARLKRFLSGELPDLDFGSIAQKPGGATRNASAAVLSYLADHVENMVVASADLCRWYLAIIWKTTVFLDQWCLESERHFQGLF